MYAQFTQVSSDQYLWLILVAAEGWIFHLRSIAMNIHFVYVTHTRSSVNVFPSGLRFF